MRTNAGQIEATESNSPLPLAMLFAREMHTSPLPPIQYEPRTQMSILGGDTIKMMGARDKSTCSRSSSTNEGLTDIFRSPDSDRKVDD